MLSEKETTRLSKFLSMVLRHQPEAAGITLDANGWTDVETLLRNLSMDRATLAYIVATSSKKRFAFNEDETKIRASQGHSVQIELGYQAANPPKRLYHGTAQQSVASIMNTGLDKRKRHHVHLSVEVATALKVGQRQGSPVVLEINAEQMDQHGYIFYQSDNGVWLTDHVPTAFIQLLTAN